MASLLDRLTGLIPSAEELKQLTDWNDRVIIDYLSFLRNLRIVATEVEDSKSETESSTFLQTQQRLNALNDRIGSGDPLTSDETGFTVDSTALTVDMTEA